jgi:hypothetical protein
MQSNVVHSLKDVMIFFVSILVYRRPRVTSPIYHGMLESFPLRVCGHAPSRFRYFSSSTGAFGGGRYVGRRHGGGGGGGEEEDHKVECNQM